MRSLGPIVIDRLLVREGKRSAEKQGVLPEVGRYLRERFEPRFPQRAPYHLAPLPRGVTSLVFELTDRRGGRLIAHVEQQQAVARRRLAAHGRLRRLGLPAPEVVYHDLSRRTLREFGFYVLVQRCQAGQTFLECAAPRQMAALAGTLYARLHGFVRWRDAVLWFSERRRQRRTARLLRKYRAHRFPWLAALQEWFAVLPAAAWRQRPRLCHGDANCQNLLFNDGQLTLIDLDHVRYTSAASELAYLRHWLLGADPQLWDAFWEQYRQAAPAPQLQEVEAALPLARMTFHMHNAMWDTITGRSWHLEQVLRLLEGRDTADLAEHEQQAFPPPPASRRHGPQRLRGPAYLWHGGIVSQDAPTDGRRQDRD